MSICLLFNAPDGTKFGMSMRDGEDLVDCIEFVFNEATRNHGELPEKIHGEGRALDGTSSFTTEMELRKSFTNRDRANVVAEYYLSGKEKYPFVTFSMKMESNTLTTSKL